MVGVERDDPAVRSIGTHCISQFSGSARTSIQRTLGVLAGRVMANGFSPFIAWPGTDASLYRSKCGGTVVFTRGSDRPLKEIVGSSICRVGGWRDERG